jgi:hypothetical protein
MQNVSGWIEYARLFVSALNPIVTGIVALVVLRLGTKIEKTKQLNQALLAKRLSFYESVAPSLNDIYCFSQARGHWSDLDPEEIIKRKRQLDRDCHINQYLFDESFLGMYQDFVDAFFEMYTGIGKPARLRLDVDFLRGEIGPAFKTQWKPYVSEHDCDHRIQANAYRTFMTFLGHEVKGDRENSKGNLAPNEVTPTLNDYSAAAERNRPTSLRTTVRSWRVANSLNRLLAQIDAIAPARNKSSDASIGEASHSMRQSDHNPWVIDGDIGVVTARDFTHDPAHGCDCEKIAAAIVAARDPRVKYIIWNRMICDSKATPWNWRPYTGPESQSHSKHIHISVLPDKNKYDNESDWNLAGVAVAKIADKLGTIKA